MRFAIRCQKKGGGAARRRLRPLFERKTSEHPTGVSSDPPTLQRRPDLRPPSPPNLRHLRHLRPSGRPTLLTSDLRPSGGYHVRTLQGSSDEDLVSCPVRAPRIYLRRTQTARGKRRRLPLPLVPANMKVRDTTTKIVSSWIKNTIIQAYSRSGTLLGLAPSLRTNKS